MTSIFEALSFLFDSSKHLEVAPHDQTKKDQPPRLTRTTSSATSTSSSTSRSSTITNSFYSLDGRTVLSSEDDENTFLLPHGSDTSLLTMGSEDLRLVPCLVKAWDVKVCPISKRVVRGHQIPTVQGAAKPFWQRSRRLTLEVHGAAAYHNAAGRWNKPVHEDLHRNLLEGRPQGTEPYSEGRNRYLHTHDVVVVRIAKPLHMQVLKRHVKAVVRRPRGGGEIHSEDVSTLGMLGTNENDDDFEPIFTYRLDEIRLVKQLGRFCELQIGSAIREIRFAREKDAQAFGGALARFKGLEYEQQARRRVRQQ